MSEEKPIRILIVDDHPMVRKGLASFLLAMDDLEWVGEAKDGLDALRRCEQSLARIARAAEEGKDDMGKETADISLSHK